MANSFTMLKARRNLKSSTLHVITCRQYKHGLAFVNNQIHISRFAFDTTKCSTNISLATGHLDTSCTYDVLQPSAERPTWRS